MIRIGAKCAVCDAVLVTELLDEQEASASGVREETHRQATCHARESGHPGPVVLDEHSIAKRSMWMWSGL